MKISCCFFCLLFFLGILPLTNAQQITEIPAAILAVHSNLAEIELQFDNYKRRAARVESYLPQNYITDGTVDYTRYIQEAVKENTIVLFPNFPLMINDKGVQLKTGSVLLFQEKSKLILKSSNKTNYNIINIENVSNVKLFYPKIEGDIFRHIGTEGEWGMGISIRSSEDVKVFNGEIVGCWGDGIYIATVYDEKTKKFGKIPRNIEIRNTICNYNSRNGIAILAGDKIKVYNSTVGNSRRTFPKAGIDIEPGVPDLKLVELVNIVTYRNKARGLDLMLRKLSHYKESKSVNIRIENYKDYDSMVGIRVAGLKSVNSRTNQIGGNISIENFRSYNNNKAIKFEDNQSYNPNIKINGVEYIGVKGVNTRNIRRISNKMFN